MAIRTRPIRYVLLFLCISISFEMIAQDTLVSKEQPKEFTKADSLQTPQWNTFAFNYPYTSMDLPIDRSIKDPELNTSGLNYPYVSDGSDVIYIGVFNVPRGTVRVTAGNRLLLEGIDYTVNYQVGTVQILDPSFAANEVPLKITVEK